MRAFLPIALLTTLVLVSPITNSGRVVAAGESGASREACDWRLQPPSIPMGLPLRPSISARPSWAATFFAEFHTRLLRSPREPYLTKRLYSEMHRGLLVTVEELRPVKAWLRSGKVELVCRRWQRRVFHDKSARGRELYFSRRLVARRHRCGRQS